MEETSYLARYVRAYHSVSNNSVRYLGNRTATMMLQYSEIIIKCLSDVLFTYVLHCKVTSIMQSAM